MDEWIKFTITGLCGVSLSYGIMKTEIGTLKEQLKSTQLYGERLAAIEAKIDILIKKENK
jgi:hypothetical protein